MNTPTTNARWEILCCSGQSWYQIAEEMKLDCRQLESELTEVTEERDRLLEEREQWSLSSAFKEIDMMGIRYAAAEMHHANNMKEVTEQRDEALSDLEFRRDLYSLQTKQLDDVREQRDRLAEALERILDYQGRFAEEDPESIAKEALQSLTKTEL